MIRVKTRAQAPLPACGLLDVYAGHKGWVASEQIVGGAVLLHDDNYVLKLG